jgi:hypothetical protein
MNVQAAPHALVGRTGALLLGDAHVDQLTAAGDHRLQHSLALVGQGLCELVQLVALQQRLAHVREHACIDVVALGQVAHGSCEVARLPWVDHDHRVAGELKGRGHFDLEAARGFQHDQTDGRAIGTKRCQMLEQLLVPGLSVVQCQRRLTVAEARFQGRLGHVHANGYRSIGRSVRQSRHRPSFYVRTEIFMQLFGLKTRGKERAPKCLVPGLQTTSPRGLRAARPRHTDKRGGSQAVDLWTMR